MCLKQEQQEHKLRSKNTIFFEEHVFFVVNHPTLPRKLKNQNIFFSLFLHFLSNQTHRITQIYKTQQHAHRFTKHKDIQQLLSRFFHILITNTKTFKDSNHKDLQQTQRTYTPSTKFTNPTKQTQMKTK